MQFFQNQFIIFFLMNFYPAQPSEAQQRQIQSQFYAIYRQLEQQHVLKTLSYALHRSLTTYSSHLQELKEAEQKAARESVTTVTQRSFERVTDFDSEHIQGRQNKAYITDQIQSILQAKNQRSSVSTMGNHQPAQKSNSQRKNSQEIPQPELKAKLNCTKTTKKPLPKEIIKENSWNEDREFKRPKVMLPEINLLETCTLPSYEMSREDLRGRKQNLLKRRIDCWPEFQRTARHKRELRNLE